MDDRTGFGRTSVVLRLTTEAPMMAIDAGDGEGEFYPAAEKYEVEATIGRGGMGEVLLVQDHDLRRQIAMKVLRPELASSRSQRLKFVAEAQATSQLEHPGIPPVHDIGVTPEGEIYFTMKLVRGRTLKDILKDLLLGVRPVRSEYTLHKLMTVLEQVSEALFFAHERGVIHRDLKPDNIMLGDYGEVHVMDWGIARMAGAEDEEGFADTVSTEGTDSGEVTQDGIVKGTIPYMSPEQASGKLSTMTTSSDVYALGCLLYEMLTLHPAFKGGGMDTLALVCAGEFKPVSKRNPRRPVPAALADLCTRSMSRLPDDRPGTAREFGEALRQWLDGRSESERRHEEAEKLAARGRKAVEQYERLKDDVLAAEDAAQEQESKFKPWQPVSMKMPLLDARRLLGDRRTELALAFAEAVNLLTAALTQERENPAACSALAALWAGKLEDAERRGDAVETAYALQMMRRHDRGELARVIEGNGTLTLTSDPEAKVELYQLEEREGILVPETEPMTGETPVGPVPLAMGRYLAVLEAPGRRKVRYPVHIRRNLRWTDHVAIPEDDEIGEEFVYVPSGPFQYGRGRDAMIRELHGFAIARYPVTFAEYAQFLMTLSEEEAARRLPQAPGDGPFMAKGEDGVYRPLGNIVEGPAHDRCVEEFGEGFEARVPVMGVSIQDAVAYCRFKTETTGREWRLPTEEEWEKAARGVDGRVFPWGDCEDASLAKCGHSRDEPAQIEPIGTFPTATSIYGMGDAAGNVWEWTDSYFDETRALRVLRGGSWSDGADYLKSYLRFGSEARTRVPNAGFRCARSLRTIG